MYMSGQNGCQTKILNAQIDILTRHYLYPMFTIREWQEENLRCAEL